MGVLRREYYPLYNEYMAVANNLLTDAGMRFLPLFKVEKQQIYANLKGENQDLDDKERTIEEEINIDHSES